MKSRPYETAVVIVGGGPVGLALASDLGWRGVPCLLVEQSDGSIYQPRMDGVNIRSLEFCRRWGILQDVYDSPYPKDFPQDMVYLTSLDGYELGRECFLTPQTGTEAAAPSPVSRVRCPQNLFDPILQRFAASLDSVQLRYTCRYVSHVETRDEVVVTLQDAASGESFEVVSQYLVGCDGGASAVRKVIDLDMQGLGSLTYTTNVIFSCPDLPGLHKIRPAYRHMFVGTEGTWATMVAINGRDQWRFSIIGNGEPRLMAEDDIRAHIRKAAGFDFAFDIVSVLPWIRRELVASTYGTDRVFLAGDAAHVMSPTGGFGMNTGLGDAVDLGWKIAATLSGWAGTGLLSTYDAERRPIGLRAAREASGNLLRTLSVGAHPDLLASSRAGALERYEVGRRFSATMLREWYTHGIGLGYTYHDSPICIPDAHDVHSQRRFSREDLARISPSPGGWFVDGTPIGAGTLRDWQRLSQHVSDGYQIATDWTELPPEEVMIYRPAALPGARAPHVWLEDGSSTLDLFGRSYVCLVRGDREADARALQDAAKARNVPFTIKLVAEPAVAALYGEPIVLIRPDGHVAWRGSALANDSAIAIVDRVRGAGITAFA